MDEVMPGDEPTEETKPERWKVTLVLVSLVIITIGNYVSTAIFATLVKAYPEWLIALSPTTRNLLLVSTEIPVFTFFLLAIVRRMLPHPLWFLIGRWYGNKGIRWVEHKSPDIGAMVKTLENYFPQYGWLLCIFYPHPLVCTMAGASKMKFWPFFFFNLIGIIFFVWVSYATGDVLQPVTHPVANFADRYKIPITVITLSLVLYSVMKSKKSGSSKLETPDQIERELEE